MAGQATAVVAAGNLGPDFDLGVQVAGKISVVPRLDSYRYGKAINANVTTSAAGGLEAFAAFVLAGNSTWSNAVRCLSAVFAPVGTGATAGGDYETQLLSWLSTATTASPAGLGLSASTSPTLASVMASLRSTAVGLPF